MNFKIIKYSIFLWGALVSSNYAAQIINLQQVSPGIAHVLAKSSPILKQISSDKDHQQTSHIRLQQTFQGYPVWGGDVVAHVPKGASFAPASAFQAIAMNSGSHITMNGHVYQDLSADLQNTPAYIFEQAQANKALQVATQIFQTKIHHQVAVQLPQTQLMVYVDQKQKAHWAYEVNYRVDNGAANKPSHPHSILDAMTLTPYRSWNGVETIQVAGGGYGGNLRLGMTSYDGLAGDAPQLSVERIPMLNKCRLTNQNVVVENAEKLDIVEEYLCIAPIKAHNNVYWDNDLEAINGGYSPANDALYIGQVVKSFYQDWYGLPVLVKNGQPERLVMRIHGLDENGNPNMENAYWYNGVMTFGDGGDMLYPLLSLSVGAHEVSHGFTEQHSNLVYDGQSGGLNESFSDMAAQAAEMYAYGSNDWLIGAGLFKANFPPALRFMNNPTQDCAFLAPDQCSIDNANNYYDGLDVHYSSGVFNKVFYLMSLQGGVRQTFAVMIEANSHYWTSTSDFADAGCGVYQAAQALGYSTHIVTQSMSQVGIDTTHC